MLAVPRHFRVKQKGPSLREEPDLAEIVSACVGFLRI